MQKINVLTIEHLQECLKDNYYNRKAILYRCNEVIDDFKNEYKIKDSDIITNLAFTIYLDSRKDLDIAICNILKSTIKDVAYKIELSNI